MASNPILTFGGERLLGALDIVDAVDLEVLLEAGEGIALGMADPDSVLVWESLNPLCANDDGTDVLLGTDEEGCVFGYLDVPAVLEWGGVVGN